MSAFSHAIFVDGPSPTFCEIVFYVGISVGIGLLYVLILILLGRVEK